MLLTSALLPTWRSQLLYDCPDRLRSTVDDVLRHVDAEHYQDAYDLLADIDVDFPGFRLLRMVVALQTDRYAEADPAKYARVEHADLDVEQFEVFVELRAHRLQNTLAPGRSVLERLSTEHRPACYLAQLEYVAKLRSLGRRISGTAAEDWRDRWGWYQGFIREDVEQTEPLLGVLRFIETFFAEDLWDPPAAASALAQARRLLREHPSPLLMAMVYGSTANLLLLITKEGALASDLEVAAKLVAAFDLEDRPDTGESLRILKTALAAAGHNASARATLAEVRPLALQCVREHLQVAMPLYEACGTWASRALCEALLLLERGEGALDLNALDQVRQTFVELGDSGRANWITTEMLDELWRNEEYTRARVLMEDLVERLDKFEHRELRQRLQHAISEIREKEPPRTLEELRAEWGGDSENRVGNRADWLCPENIRDELIQYLGECTAQTELLDESIQIAVAYGGNQYGPSTAMPSLRKLEEQARHANNRHTLACSLLIQAPITLSIGLFPHALKALEDLDTEFPQLSKAPRVRLMWARLEAEDNQIEDSLATALDAAKRAVERRSPQHVESALNHMAALAEDRVLKEDIPEVWADEALETLSALSPFDLGESASSALARITGLFCLHTLGRAYQSDGAAGVVQRLERARALLASSPSEPGPVHLECAADTTVLFFFIRRGKYRVIRISGAEVNSNRKWKLSLEKVDEHRYSLRSLGDKTNVKGLRALFKPLRKLTPRGGKIRRLVIVPIGALCRTPWSLIFPDHEVTVAPSLSQHHAFERQIDRPPVPADLLTLGRAAADSVWHQREARLVAAWAGVAADVVAPIAWTGRRLEVVRTSVSRHRHLHLVGWAPLEYDSDGREYDADNQSRFGWVPERLDGCGLVVLNTTQGTVDSALGYPGGHLVQALIEAGVSCVVAPLWEVPNHVRFAFSHAFYEFLQMGLTPGAAVHAARGRLRTRNPKTNGNHWAAYQVIGSAGARVTLPKPAWSGGPVGRACVGAYLFEAGQYASAYPLLVEGAESGDAEAQYRLALAKEQGLGCRRLKRAHEKWVVTAAQAGHTLALGECLIEGTGPFKADPRRGLELIEGLARRCHLLAEGSLAGYLIQGEHGVPRDVKRGLELLQRAAARGLMLAQWILESIE